MRRALALLAAVLLVASFPSGDATANARDPDGSRMQARQIAVGSSARDQLQPPRDSVDWHYFKLRGAKRVSISLSSAPAGNVAQIRVTNAMGKSVASSATRDGKASIARRLDPGVYYVSVSSPKQVTYTLSVK